MIPAKAIKKFTKPAHREIVVGILVAYGLFPKTTDGINQAKKFVDGLDQWIAPSELPDYYDDIDSDLIIGKETPKILNIKDTLEEFYFRTNQGVATVEDLPIEEIPVVLEIKETEIVPDFTTSPNSEPDPVSIIVDVPVTPPKNAPRRIKLPRRKGVIRKKRDISLAQRMSASFDRNLLGPLIEEIRNPVSAPAKSKKTKSLKEKIVSKKEFAGLSKGSSPSVGGNDLLKVGFSKIRRSFSLAARARKAFKESGGNPSSLPRMYFLGKTLSSEFGGDFIRRTKGTFSSNPDETLDPALSKEERLSAIIQRDISARPTMMRQEELFDVSKYEDADFGKTFLDLSRKTADKILGIESGFIKIEKSQKETSKYFDIISNNTKKVSEQYVKISSNLNKFVENNEKTLAIKNKLSNFLYKQQEKEQFAKAERSAEQLSFLSGLQDVKEVDQEIQKEDENTDGDVNISGGDLGPASITRRGFRRSFRRGAISLFGRRGGRFINAIGSSAIGRAGNVVVNAGKSVATRVASSISGKAVVGFLRPIFKRVPIIGGLIDFVVSLALGENPGRAAAKAIGATVGAGLGTFIPIPIVGTLLGGVVGDLLGGTIYDAVTGGSGGSTPKSKTPPEEKLSQGGVKTIAGEAGNEIYQPLTSSFGRSVLKGMESGASFLPVIGPTLSAAAGIARSPIFGEIVGPTINPIIEPLLSQYKVPVYSGDIGSVKTTKLKAAAGQSKAKQEKIKKNPLQAIQDFFGGAISGIGRFFGGVLTGVGGFFSGLFRGGGNTGPVTPVNVPSGKDEKIKAALNFYLSKGFSKTGAAYMVGNLLQESQLDPAAVGDNGRAHGLAQWREDQASGARWLGYLEWARANNKQPGDFYAQLEYTIVEGETYNRGLPMMKGDDIESHKAYVKRYEGYSEEGNRFGFAEDILQNWDKYQTGGDNNKPTQVVQPTLSPIFQQNNTPQAAPAAGSWFTNPFGEQSSNLQTVKPDNVREIDGASMGLVAAAPSPMSAPSPQKVSEELDAAQGISGIYNNQPSFVMISNGNTPPTNQGNGPSGIIGGQYTRGITTSEIHLLALANK